MRAFSPRRGGQVVVMTEPDFIGCIQVRPALNEAEQDFLLDLIDSHRTLRGTPTGRGDTDVPFARLAWEVCCDGCCLEWNSGEHAEWMLESLRVVIDHWLKPGAKAEGHPRFSGFTFDHVLSGAVMGGSCGDLATRLVSVADNIVTGRVVPEPCGESLARPLAERTGGQRPDNVIEFRPRRA
jgi:hypothetical protein